MSGAELGGGCCYSCYHKSLRFGAVAAVAVSTPDVVHEEGGGQRDRVPAVAVVHADLDLACTAGRGPA